MSARQSRKKVAVPWLEILNEIEKGGVVEIARPQHLTIYQTRDEMVRVAEAHGLKIDWRIILGHLDMWRVVPEISETRKEPMERLTLLMDLKALRLEAGVTLEMVEELSGVLVKSYRVVEGGATPSLETALKIARFLELPVEEIWGMREEEKDEGSGLRVQGSEKQAGAGAVEADVAE